MAFWAKWMFIASGAGVILTALALAAVVRTLHHTKRAADASFDMVRQASRANDITEDALTTRERPYVMPGEISAIRDAETRGGGTNRFVSCKIGNYGKTPAIIHYILDSYGPTPDNHYSDPDSGVRKLAKDYNRATIVSAGEMIEKPFLAFFPAVVKFVGTGNNIIPEIPGHKDLFLVINIKTEDVKGVVRIGRFTWKFDPLYRRFLRYGGKAFNYETEVET